MKKTLPIIVLTFALMTLNSQAMHFFFRQTAAAIPAQTNYVAVTNPAGQIIGTNVTVTPAVVPQFEIAPTVTKVLTTGETAAGFIPPPYDAAVTVGLTAIGGILGFILKKKNGQLSTTQTILQSVITGVEAVGDASTKLSIQSHANAAGVQPQLEPIVQTVTANAPGPIIPQTK